jgi:hypothetical protein
LLARRAKANHIGPNNDVRNSSWEQAIRRAADDRRSAGRHDCATAVGAGQPKIAARQAGDGYAADQTINNQATGRRKQRGSYKTLQSEISYAQAAMRQQGGTPYTLAAAKQYADSNSGGSGPKLAAAKQVMPDSVVQTEAGGRDSAAGLHAAGERQRGSRPHGRQADTTQQNHLGRGGPLGRRQGDADTMLADQAVTPTA